MDKSSSICFCVCLQKTTTPPTSSVLALSTLLCLAFSLCFCVWIDEGEAVLMWTCCHTLPNISHTDFWSVPHHPLQLALWFYFIFSFFLSLSSHIPPLSFQWCNAFFTFTQTHVHWLHILQQFFSTDPNKTTNLSSTQWIISIILIPNIQWYEIHTVAIYHMHVKLNGQATSRVSYLQLSTFCKNPLPGMHLLTVSLKHI